MNVIFWELRFWCGLYSPSIFVLIECIWWTHSSRLHLNSLDGKMFHLSKSRMYYTVCKLHTYSMRRAWQLWNRAYIYHSICFSMALKRRFVKCMNGTFNKTPIKNVKHKKTQKKSFCCIRKTIPPKSLMNDQFTLIYFYKRTNS